MKKKTMTIIASIFLIATITICTTLAFLTDEETSVNTFTVGKVKITLTETAVDELGVPIANAAPVTENKYHLLPGKTYVKDPTITIEEDSESSYIRMLVTLNMHQQLLEIFGEDFSPGNYVNGYNSEKWLYNGSSKNIIENTITYEYRYYEPVSGLNNGNKVLEPLFNSLIVPGYIEGEDLAKISTLEIKVVGHAIQKSGFKNADEAWEAFEEQYER